MSAHTPGPWSAEPVGPLPHAIRIVSPRAIRISPRSGPGFCYLPEGRQDVQEANARLMAAAPELLAALKAALPLVCWAVSDVMGNDGYESFGEAESLVRAAIAKAEGRA